MQRRELWTDKGKGKASWRGYWKCGRRRVALLVVVMALLGPCRRLSRRQQRRQGCCNNNRSNSSSDNKGSNKTVPLLGACPTQAL